VLDRHGARRTALVTTLQDEVPARYRDGSRASAAWIHALSDGKVGYLHIPDMMGAGFAEFHRYFAVECDRDGLIVDVRYNRGGHVSQLLLEKVARKRIAYDLQRWGRRCLIRVNPRPGRSCVSPTNTLGPMATSSPTTSSRCALGRWLAPAPGAG